MTPHNGSKRSCSPRHLRRLVLATLITCPVIPAVGDTYRNPFVQQAEPTPVENESAFPAGWETSAGTSAAKPAVAPVTAPGSYPTLPTVSRVGYPSAVQPQVVPQAGWVAQDVPLRQPAPAPPAYRPAPPAYRPAPPQYQQYSAPSYSGPPMNGALAIPQLPRAGSPATPPSTHATSPQLPSFSQLPIPQSVSRAPRPHRLPAPPRSRQTSRQLDASGSTGVPARSVVTVPTVNSGNVGAKVVAAKDRDSALEHPAETASDVVSKSDPGLLRSITPATCRKKALQLLDDANREYSVKAWVSAEHSAWESLRYAAQAVDVAERQLADTHPRRRASEDLREARTAIREARDFGLHSESLDAEGIRRLVQSHKTTVLHGDSVDALTPTDAADLYLDHARQLLGRLATYHVSTAATLDLLAAIELGRDQTNRMPAATALCLRRGALQGQPGNSSLAARLGQQLADMGLDQEAKWTLEHAMSIQPSAESAKTLAIVMQRTGDRQAAMELTAQLKREFSDETTSSRVPDVIQLTPAQFASVSPNIHQLPGNPAVRSGGGGYNVSAASASANPTGLSVSSASFRTQSAMPASVASQPPGPQASGTTSLLPSFDQVVSPFQRILPGSDRATGQSVGPPTQGIVDGAPSGRQGNPYGGPLMGVPGAAADGRPVSNVQRFLDRMTELW